MEIREFATRVLHGADLADKLLKPAELTDRAPGAPARAPPGPGRPDAVAFGRERAARFPGVAALSRAGERGRVLHAFANHELLALELMALALLRFPAAPTRFRRGLVATMAEEQKHLRLYLDRMAHCGVELGEAPVSGYFWTAMADVASPYDFVARMSLTFEQANLDFARYYADAFRQVGDTATADVLDVVYVEEIRHVRHGLTWFRRWRDDTVSDFDAHRDALPAPLTLARAKGIGFDVAGRQRAGFDVEYIDRLRVFNASKGRPPAVHLFNPTCELEIAGGLGYTPDRYAKAMTRDLEALPMFLATAGDVVLVTRAPSMPHLQALQRCGFVIPQFVERPEGGEPIPARAVPNPRVGELRPWGWSPHTDRLLRPLLAKLPAGHEPFYRAPWDPSRAEPFSKATAARWCRRFLEARAEPALAPPDVAGTVAASADEAFAAVAARRHAGWAVVVIKAPLGVSGRNAQRLFDPEPTAAQRRWVERIVGRQGCVVVEPWLPNVCDLSVRMTVVRPGNIRIDGIGRFMTDERGQYRGALIGRLGEGLAPDLLRFLHGDGRDPKRLRRVFSMLADDLATWLEPSGYVGPVGVDALVYRDGPSGFRLQPLVEINPRGNMGHVAQAMRDRIHPQHVGFWMIVTRDDLDALGLEDFEALSRWLQRWAPLQLRPGGPAGTSGPSIESGALLTTDPTAARSFASVLLVARDLAGCAAMVARLEGRFCALAQRLITPDPARTVASRPSAAPPSE